MGQVHQLARANVLGRPRQRGSATKARGSQGWSPDDDGTWVRSVGDGSKQAQRGRVVVPEAPAIEMPCHDMCPVRSPQFKFRNALGNKRFRMTFCSDWPGVLNHAAGFDLFDNCRSARPCTRCTNGTSAENCKPEQNILMRARIFGKRLAGLAKFTMPSQARSGFPRCRIARRQ